MLKDDGVSTWTDTAIRGVMNKLDADPHWQGDRASGSGRPRKTSKTMDKQIVKFVVTNRGRKKVTVMKVRKQLPELRSVSKSLVESRLREADYAYLRRRKKSKVSKLYLQDRVDYCEAVRKKHKLTLEKWAYTDGTVYYLDRTEEENEQTQTAALGSMVWRRADRSDAMYQDCLGPSGYNKAQGKAIRVWGMLAFGFLYVHILDEGDVMNTELYCELIEEKFETWMGNCTWLVCDFERCIRSQAAIQELARIGLRLVDEYPRCSQDFNAIENAWSTEVDSSCTQPPPSYQRGYHLTRC